jgi:hypothetical protein
LHDDIAEALRRINPADRHASPVHRRQQRPWPSGPPATSPRS